MSAGLFKTLLLCVLLLAFVLVIPSSAAGHMPDGMTTAEGVEAEAIEPSVAQTAPTEQPVTPPVVSNETDPIESGSETGAELEDISGIPAPTFPIAAQDRQTFECQNGMAGPFPCKNVDLESAAPLGGAGLGSGNDVWGWTDPKTNREYALVGSALATTFVDVTDPQDPLTVGHLPTAEDAPPNFVLWRDVKVDGNWAFIVSEISGHGMQVFDLTRLRDAGPIPQVFTSDALYRGADDAGIELGNAHNVAVNEATNFAYVVGSNTCVSSGDGGQNGGLHMVDISDPKSPEFAGCARVTNPANLNYSHDVQCVVYRGPDPDYRGREICLGSNEEAVVVYDVTNKRNPTVISTWGYPQASYTHQGWLTPDQRFFLFGDEGDEQAGTVDNTTTYIMDASDLDNPKVPKPFFHETRSIDHNLYIRGDLVFEANYGAGLRVLEFSNQLLSNGRLNEVGYFDIRPGFDEPEFVGTWSNYPYFKSGIVVMSGIEEGTSVLYVLRPTGDAAIAGAGAGGGSGGGGSGGGGSGGGGSGGGGGGQNEGPQQLGETTSSGGGGALALTGAQLAMFLLLGIAMIAAGAAIERAHRTRDAENLRW